MSDENSNNLTAINENLSDIRVLLEEINSKTTHYIQSKLVFERVLDISDKEEYVLRALKELEWINKDYFEKRNKK